jgi:Flp pilus assembly protein TadD
MEQLRNGDAQSARVYLYQAAAAAPGNPLVHAGLAAAWSALGLDIRAGHEAKLAFDSSSELGRVEQLEIEGRYRAITEDWPRAIEVYQALFTLLPDDLEYGLLLASAQAMGGRGQEALTTVQALRRLPSPAGDDPRIDLAEARAAGGLSDFERTRRMAHSAAEKAKARGARLQYARARLLESGAMQNLSAAGFADVRTEARQICTELGDLACVAAAYRIEANATLGYGNIAGARVRYEPRSELPIRSAMRSKS